MVIKSQLGQNATLIPLLLSRNLRYVHFSSSSSSSSPYTFYSLPRRWSSLLPTSTSPALSFSPAQEHLSTTSPLHPLNISLITASMIPSIASELWTTCLNLVSTRMSTLFSLRNTGITKHLLFSGGNLTKP